MKRYLASINEASFRSGLSPLQIYSLTRNKLLKLYVEDKEVKIELRMLIRWINKNDLLSSELKKELDNRIESVTLKTYIKNYGKKRNN